MDVETTESKNDRFIRLVEPRTNKVLDTIRVLGHCSNKASYEYNEDDVNKVFNALEKELKIAKDKFLSTVTQKEKFTLK